MTDRDVPTTAKAILARLDAVDARLKEQSEHFRMESHRKQAIIAEQSRRLKDAEGGLFRELQLPLVSAIGAVIDRLRTYDGPDATLADSVREELLEALAMLDIHPAPTADGFDPALHRAVRTVADPAKEDGAVVEVWSGGWVRGDAVIRHASVVVNKRTDKTPKP